VPFFEFFGHHFEIPMEMYRSLPNAALWVIPQQEHTPLWVDMGSDRFREDREKLPRTGKGVRWEMVLSASAIQSVSSRAQLCCRRHKGEPA